MTPLPVQTSQTHQTGHALSDVRRHLRKSALKLVGYLVVAYLILRLIPTLNEALHSLRQVSWEWIVGAILLEVISETGFVIAWRRIVDPDGVLERDGRGWRMDQRVAWAQLGGGLLVPGGSLGGMGVGGWILHRFGMSTDVIAERQFNLSFLNTTVDAFALVIFGLGLATGILAGEGGLLLTLLPATLAACGIALALVVAGRARSRADRAAAEHAKIARVIGTLAKAVDDTKRLVVDRGNWVPLAGAVAYLGFDLVILWLALHAVHAQPVPTFAVVLMAYIIGALGGRFRYPRAWARSGVSPAC